MPAQVENVGIHTLRHSAAVTWLESGVHIKAAADLLGNSSIAVTGDIYGHSTDSTARAAIDGLTSGLGPPRPVGPSWRPRYSGEPTPEAERVSTPLVVWPTAGGGRPAHGKEGQNDLAVRQGPRHV